MAYLDADGLGVVWQKVKNEISKNKVNVQEVRINISETGSWVDNTANSLYYKQLNITSYLSSLKELLTGSKQVSASISVDWNGTRFEMPTTLETFRRYTSSDYVPYFKWRVSKTTESYFVIGSVTGVGVSGVYFPYDSTNKSVLARCLDDWEMYDGIELVVRVIK